MTAAGYARTVLEWVLNRRGFTIRQKNEPPRGFRDFFALYRQHGPMPEVVFDIGVGNGTLWLYEAFPDATFMLIEPLRDFAPKIDAILQMYKGECHYCALGEHEGEITLHVPIGVPTGSSLLPRDPDWAAYVASGGDRGTCERTVELIRLDRIAASRLGPHVIKIDVEGAELQVMRGGPDCVLSARR